MNGALNMIIIACQIPHLMGTRSVLYSECKRNLSYSGLKTQSWHRLHSANNDGWNVKGVTHWMK